MMWMEGVSMTAEQLDRLRFVTRHFNQMQGLRFHVRFGLILVTIMSATLVGDRYPLLGLSLSLLSMAASVLLTRSKTFLRDFYASRYGVVEEGTQQGWPAPLAVDGIGGQFSLIGPHSYPRRWKVLLLVALLILPLP